MKSWMKNKTVWASVVVAVLVVTALAFQNCGSAGSGGGGSGNPVNFGAKGTGAFIDAPVQGLYYTTSSGLTGLTDANGQFLYNPGDTVTFYAEGVLLGSMTPAPGATGFTTATPLSLVPGNSGVTDPQVTAIAQFLSSLNTVGGGTTTYIIPSSPNSSSTSGGTVPSGATTTQLQSLMSAALGGTPTSYTITSAATAQTSLQNGVNTIGIVGSVWSASCTSGCTGGAYVLFAPGGSVVGFTGDGSLSGTWSTDGSGNTTWSVSTSCNGGGSATGAISSGSTSGTGTVHNSDNTTGTLSTSMVSASSGFTGTSFEGAWHATYSPYVVTNNNSGGGAYCIFGPGTFYCITNDGQLFSGSYDNSGAGTFSFSSGGSSGTNSGSFNLASYSGTVSNSDGGGTLSWSRGGSMCVTKNNGPNPTATP